MLLGRIWGGCRVLSCHRLRACVHAHFTLIQLIGVTCVIFNTPKLKSFGSLMLWVILSLEGGQSVLRSKFTLHWVHNVLHWVTVKALVLIIILAFAGHLLRNYWMSVVLLTVGSIKVISRTMVIFCENWLDVKGLEINLILYKPNYTN